MNTKPITLNMNINIDKCDSNQTQICTCHVKVMVIIRMEWNYIFDRNDKVPRVKTQSDETATACVQ